MQNKENGTMVMLRLVDPAAELNTKDSALAPRLDTLAGKRVAIIDNCKHMSVPFLEATEALLASRYNVASFEHFRKRSASVAMPPEEMERLAASCDAVVHGIAD